MRRWIVPVRNRKPGKNPFDLAMEFLAFLAGLLLLLITLVVSYTVVIRYLSFRPPQWVLQFTEYALLWMTFLGGAWLLRGDGHIRIDTVIIRLRPAVRRRVEMLDDILGFVVCAVIFWFGTAHTIDLFERGILDVKGVTVPKDILFAVIPIGGLMLALQFARNFLKKVRASRSNGQS
jgi:C4-dicarboxylate transporter, DctQ subunit